MATTVEIPIAVGADDNKFSKQDVSIYPPITNAGGAAPGTGSVNCAATKSLVSTTYTISVCFLRFNTGAEIPDNATIDSASLKIYPLNFANNATDNKSVVGEYYTWPVPPTVSDYAENVGSGAFSRDLDLLSGAAAVSEIPFSDVSGISKTGYTSLRIGLSGGQPVGNNNLNILTYEYDTANGTNFKPKLSVTYSLPSERLTPDGIQSQSGWTPALVLADVQVDPDA